MSLTITDIAPQKKQKNRFNVYTHDGFLLSLSDETISKYKIKTGLALSDKLLKELKSYDTIKYANELSLKYTSYKPRTQAKLKTYLIGKGIDLESAEAAIQTMREYGYIDDALFAKEYAKEYLSKYSAAVVKMRLINEGVGKEAIEEALQESEEQSADTVKKIFDHLNQKYSTIDDKNKRKQKICQAMLRRGFSYSDFSSFFDAIESFEY